MNAVGPQHTTRIVVISADTAHGPNPEGVAAIRHAASLLGAVTHSARGKYQGLDEDSVIVLINATDEEKADKAETLLLSLAAQLNQESILVVQEHTREAALRFVKGKASLALGKWTRVLAHEAEAAESYTYDITNGQWYVCR